MKDWPSSLAATRSASPLRSRLRASSWARSASKRLRVVLGGAERLALRQEEVAGIAVADADDIAHLAEAGDAFEKDDLHGDSPCSVQVRGGAPRKPPGADVEEGLGDAEDGEQDERQAAEEDEERHRRRRG